jgi:hypothetical protein
MWFLIKRTVKDPSSPPVMKVKKIVNLKKHSYTTQTEAEEAIQKEYEIRSTLAHRALITKMLLGTRCRYLGDEELTKSIVEGTYDIPTYLDDATKFILEEIGKTGMGIRNCEGK